MFFSFLFFWKVHVNSWTKPFRKLLWQKNCVVNLRQYYNICSRLGKRDLLKFETRFFFSHWSLVIWVPFFVLESQVIFGVVVAVVCLVVHSKIAIKKMKWIRFHFKRIVEFSRQSFFFHLFIFFLKSALKLLDEIISWNVVTTIIV